MKNAPMRDWWLSLPDEIQRFFLTKILCLAREPSDEQLEEIPYLLRGRRLQSIGLSQEQQSLALQYADKLGLK